MITDPATNPERRRWYGLRIGDTVTIERGKYTAEVIGLGYTDNNRCQLRLEDGRETPYVAEWCTRVAEDTA